jgi:hypothetical protein
MIRGQRWGNVGSSRMPFRAFSCTSLDVIAESAGGNRGSASHFGSEGWGFNPSGRTMKEDIGGNVGGNVGRVYTGGRMAEVIEWRLLDGSEIDLLPASDTFTLSIDDTVECAQATFTIPEVRFLRDALTEWLDTEGIGYFVADEPIRAGDPVVIVNRRAVRATGQPMLIAERDYEPGEKIKWSLT